MTFTVHMRAGFTGAALSLALAFLLIAGAAGPAPAAGDLAAGKRKAVACQACHGLDGLSKMPEAPNLAGQPVPYLAKALGEFRAGKRQNEMMSIVAKSLSDADVADLAAYYAAFQITVRPP